MSSVPNVLEEITITTVISWSTAISMDPAAWNMLDIVLSSGFPYLRKLTIDVEMGVMAGDVQEEAEATTAALQKIFDEKFEWSRKNLTFGASGRGVAI